VTLQRLADHRIGEDSDDLLQWLSTLEGCPSVEVTTLAACQNEAHGDDKPTWFYVEADAAAGAARRRCLACGDLHHLLDSAAHWPEGVHTQMCPTCRQSMFEVGAGLHTVPGADADQPVVTWAAVATRCVTCSRVNGLTDMFVPGVPVAHVVAAI
jgi:hypothetical protein